MAVSVQEISRLHEHSADIYRGSEIKDVRVPMRYRQSSSKQLESRLAYGRQFTHGPICDIADAAQCGQDGRVHVTHERA